MKTEELNSLIHRLRSFSSSAKETKLLLLSSLITFNGILISAFAIIISLNPAKYDQYIILYFLISFIPIAGSLFVIYRIKEHYQVLTLQTIYDLYKENPDALKQRSDDFIEQYTKTKPKYKKSDRFINILEKIVFIFSFLNMLSLFM
ncbi:MAG: hypothetical protein L6Q94_23625, partial [Calditrichia bacterium]|nr:hypothetical protein [Calditrichia bacterium]